MDRVIFCTWCNEALEPDEDFDMVQLADGTVLTAVCLDCQEALGDAGYLPREDWMKDEVMV